jgi:hypothetical protein
MKIKPEGCSKSSPRRPIVPSLYFCLPLMLRLQIAASRRCRPCITILLLTNWRVVPSYQRHLSLVCVVRLSMLDEQVSCLLRQLTPVFVCDPTSLQSALQFSSSAVATPEMWPFSALRGSSRVPVEICCTGLPARTTLDYHAGPPSVCS